MAPTILNSLQDSSVTDFGTTAGTVGPGDVEFAFQWDLSIPAGGSVTISKIKQLQVNVIPEPTTFALSFMGLALLAVRKLRKA